MFFDQAAISDLIIHSLRSNGHEKELLLSDDKLQLDTDLLSVLETYFFKKFTQEHIVYQFAHEHDLSLNKVYSFSRMIFEGVESFLEISKDMANFLYTKSTSPSIKPGELYVMKIKGVLFEGKEVDGIGIFKSENKDIFLKVFPEKGGFQVAAHEGVNINKLDKGAIILNTDKQEGYIVAMIDNTNGNEQAKYWKDDFLKVGPRGDDFYQTQRYIKVIRDFVDQHWSEEDNRLDGIDLIHKSMEYFKSNDQFDEDDFQTVVLQNEKTIDLFDQFKDGHQNDNELTPISDFEISKPAVKKFNRFIRSVIKLDKYFHIYVHGMRDRIERGYDDARHLNYYKVYFEEEN